MHRFTLIACIWALLLAFTAKSIAYEVQPMKMAFDTGSGSPGPQQIIVKNTDSQNIALEIDVFEMVDGEQKKSDDFIIFPPLASVEPGKSQSFQVRYAAQSSDAIKEYQILVRQLPIEFVQSDGAAIKVGVNFGVSVNAGPGAIPE